MLVLNNFFFVSINQQNQHKVSSIMFIKLWKLCVSFKTSKTFIHWFPAGHAFPILLKTQCYFKKKHSGGVFTLNRPNQSSKRVCCVFIDVLISYWVTPNKFLGPYYLSQKQHLYTFFFTNTKKKHLSTSRIAFVTLKKYISCFFPIENSEWPKTWSRLISPSKWICKIEFKNAKHGLVRDLNPGPLAP